MLRQKTLCKSWFGCNTTTTTQQQQQQRQRLSWEAALLPEWQRSLKTYKLMHHYFSLAKLWLPFQYKLFNICSVTTFSKNIGKEVNIFFVSSMLLKNLHEYWSCTRAELGLAQLEFCSSYRPFQLDSARANFGPARIETN